MFMNTKLIPFIDISTENIQYTNWNSILKNIVIVVVRLICFLCNQQFWSVWKNLCLKSYMQQILKESLSVSLSFPLPLSFSLNFVD